MTFERSVHQEACDEWADAICRDLPRVGLRSGVLGSQLSTYAIGGPLRHLIEPKTAEDLLAVLRILSSAGRPYKVLGAGSNLLLSSAGLACPVVRLSKDFRWLTTLQNGRFEVGGAYGLMALSRELSEAGFSGLEFAGGIPASVGGAVRMNAGAHGGEICDVLEEVRIVSPRSGMRTLKGSELTFSYRHSNLDADDIVISVVLAMTPGNADSIRATRANNLAERKLRQPLQLPSAGSVFRNPSRDSSAGQLIEAAGLKGSVSGGALISPQHANWIVNPNRSATDSDVWSLVRLAQDEVNKRFGVLLRPEVIRWSDEAEIR